MSHVRFVHPLLVAVVFSSGCTRKPCVSGPCCEDGKAAEASTPCVNTIVYDRIEGCGVTSSAVETVQYCSGFDATCTGPIEQRSFEISCSENQILSLTPYGGHCSCDRSCCGDAQMCQHECCAPGESCIRGACAEGSRTVFVTPTEGALLESIAARGSTVAIAGLAQRAFSLGDQSFEPAVGTVEWFVASGTTNGSFAWIRGMPMPGRISVTGGGEVIAMGFLFSTVPSTIGTGAAHPATVPPIEALLAARFTVDGEVARVTVLAAHTEVAPVADVDGEVARVTAVTAPNTGHTEVAAVADGSFVVAGTMRHAITIAPGQPGETTLYGAPDAHSSVFVAKFGADDSLSWAHLVAATRAYTYVGDVAPTPDGGVVISLVTQGRVTVGLGPNRLSAGAYGANNSIVAKLSPSGEAAWVCETEGSIGALAAGRDGDVAFSVRGAPPVLKCRTSRGPERLSSTLLPEGSSCIVRVSSSGVVDRVLVQSGPFGYDTSGRLVVVTDLPSPIDDCIMAFNSTLVVYDEQWAPLSAKQLWSCIGVPAVTCQPPPEMQMAISGDDRSILISNYGNDSMIFAPGEPLEQSGHRGFILGNTLPP